MLPYLASQCRTTASPTTHISPIFSGDTLYELYEAYGPRILEYNVRAFLQTRGKVNRGIRETIRDHPGHFMAYNNGISVTADEVRTSTLNGGTTITGFKGLQIVNGGQTTASIHRARKRDRFDLSRVQVPAKVTRLPPENVEKMVPRISRFANTQNVIQEADFSSNEPFHIAIERLSQRTWAPGERTRWFYERSRGQYQTAINIEGSTPARLRAFRERTPTFTEILEDRSRQVPEQLEPVAARRQRRTPEELHRLHAKSSARRAARAGSQTMPSTATRSRQAITVSRGPAHRTKRGIPGLPYQHRHLPRFLSLASNGWTPAVWISSGNDSRSAPHLEALLRTWSHDIDRRIQTSAAGQERYRMVQEGGLLVGESVNSIFRVEEASA